MNEKNKKMNAKDEWTMSQHAMKAAEVLLKEDLPDQAVSRIYYAAFHAAKALLLTQGLEAKTHQGLGRLFSLHFIKTGIIDTKFSRILSETQKDREDADYFSEYVFTKESVTERFEEIKEFLKVVQKFL